MDKEQNNPSAKSREHYENLLVRRFGCSLDELKLLYPKDEDLIDFYNQVAMKASSFDTAEPNEEIPDDTYKLSAQEKKSLADFRKRKQVEANRRARRAAAKKAIAPAPPTPAPTEAKALPAPTVSAPAPKKATPHRSLADLLKQAEKIMQNPDDHLPKA